MKRPFLLLYVNELMSHRYVIALDELGFAYYMKMLFNAWKSDEAYKLPNVEAELINAAGCKDIEKWATRREDIMKNWKVSKDGKWIVNGRLKEEYQKVLDGFKKRQAAGSKGGTAKAKASKVLAMPSNASQCQSDAKQSLATQTQIDKEQNPLSAKADDDPISQQMLDQIRKVHPRGTEDTRDSEKAIRKAIQREKAAYGSHRKAAEYLWKRTQVFAQKVSTWPAEDKQFVKMCATWFNKGSYADMDSAWDRKPQKTEPYAVKPVAVRTVEDVKREREKAIAGGGEDDD